MIYTNKKLKILSKLKYKNNSRESIIILVILDMCKKIDIKTIKLLLL